MKGKEKKHFLRRIVAAFMALAIMALCMPVKAGAARNFTADSQDTGIDMEISEEGAYSNWEGVSNIDQFTDGNGNYYFAYDTKKYVYIVKPDKKKVKLKKPYNTFGGAACDSAGNFYVVTGKENPSDDTEKNTIFVSKYNKKGKLIKTTGDNGSSSLDYYYDSGFYTRSPFNAGSCDIAVNGKILTVHYAREMYSGHQSNSVFSVNTETMESVKPGIIYQSHCFAERAVPYKNGFIYAGEGDCYNRAFTITIADGTDSGRKEGDIFHFWVKKDSLKNWDMYTLNDNFAHMGGLAVAGENRVAFTGTSVKALNGDAAKQKEQLFIQIFDPTKDLSNEDAYITKGVRTGISGPNGDEKATDYGVKWLTNFKKGIDIKKPQIVSDGEGTIMVLFEKYSGGKYKGVFGIKMDSEGNITEKTACISKDALLNPGRMPVYHDGSIYWTGNKFGDSRIYTFKVEM